MKKRCLIFEFIIIGIVGALSHFIYEWSGENPIVGAIAPVNESVWEHLKLLFFPTIAYSFIEYFSIKNKPENYIPSVAVSLFSGLATIVIFFYTYTGVLGFNVSALDIGSFYLALLVMLIIKRKILNGDNFTSGISKTVSLYFVGLMTVLFVIWTFFPLTLGIFNSP